MESRKAGVLIRLENGDVGNSDVEVRSLYSPPICGRGLTVGLLPSKQFGAGSTPVVRSYTYPWCKW